jgi:copper transport protein
MKRAALGAFLLTIAVALTAAPAALAHTELVSSDPADGTVLATAPTSVVLTFDEDVLEAAVTISDASTSVVSSPNGTVAGSTVTVPWPDGLPDGSYAVNFRVVSMDGHPVAGQIALAFGAGATLDPAVRPDAAATGSALPFVAIGLGLAVGAGIGVFYAVRRRAHHAS